MKKMALVAVLIIFIFSLSAPAFSQDADLINSAVAAGDLETLYNFIQEPEGKEQRLINTAANTIRRYTAADTSTASYRTNKMDARVRSIGAELLENLFDDPAAHLPAVVARLTSGVSNQFAKVKVIHDWICYHIAYDADRYFGRNNNRQDYVSVIKNKMAVCSGYASLFNEMCRLASVESITISGFSKGFGYSGYIGNAPDHDWNAVKINGKWYLVDVTWDAGHLAYRSFIKSYSTDYLFLDPRPFLYSHLPLQNKFQFYAPVVTKEQFMDEPYIPGKFFKYGAQLKNDLPRYNNLTNGSFTVEITSRNSAVSFTCALRTPSQRDVAGADWQERSGNTISFIYDVPDKGDYQGLIFARFNNERRIETSIPINRYEQRIIPKLDELVQNKRITEREKEYFINSYYKIEYNGAYYFLEDQFDTARNNAVLKIHPLVDLSLSMYEYILSFNLKAAPEYSGYSGEYNIRFPKIYSSLLEVSNTKILSPINGELTAGTVQKFLISSRDFTRIYAVINRRNVYLERNSTGIYELEIEIPSGISNIMIYGIRGSAYSGLLEYAVK